MEDLRETLPETRWECLEALASPLAEEWVRRPHVGGAHPLGCRLTLRSEVLFRQSQLFFHSLKKSSVF